MPWNLVLRFSEAQSHVLSNTRMDVIIWYVAFLFTGPNLSAKSQASVLIAVT